MSALDFSSTPEGDARRVQTKHIALLREILDRIDIPPAVEVPGDDEVQADGLEKWTIPNTSISIQQIQNGPMAG